MAYKIQITARCVGCGLCFSSPYIEETPDGMAAVKGAGIIDSGAKDAFVRVLDACPQKAITIMDMNTESSEASRKLQQQLTNQLDKLKNYKLARPVPKDFPFKRDEYSIAVPVASGENRYEYSSESSAVRAAKSEFDKKMYSQIDYYILQVITQYRAKYVLPYYSKNAEDKSVYLKCNKEVSEILSSIEDLLKIAHIADGLPKDFSTVDIFPDNETAWKMLNKGELLSDEMVSTIRSEFNSGNYSSLDSYDMYWDTDDMEVSAGTDWRGNLKFKDKYCYRNVREAFKELAKDLLDACYYADDRLQYRAVEVAGWLVDAYNEKLEKILSKKIAFIESKLPSMPSCKVDEIKMYDDIPQLIGHADDGLHVNHERVDEKEVYLTEAYIYEEGLNQYFYDSKEIKEYYVDNGIRRYRIVLKDKQPDYGVIVGYRGRIIFSSGNDIYEYVCERGVCNKVIKDVLRVELYKDTIIYSTLNGVSNDRFDRCNSGTIGYYKVDGSRRGILLCSSYGDGVIALGDINDHEIHYEFLASYKKGCISWDYSRL